MYFPCKLVKTADLNPNENYIMGYHPHGVYALSAFANILFSSNFQKNFPGIQPRGSTLTINFYLPIWREICMAYGTISVDRQVIYNTLTRSKNGTCLILVVGGAKEFTLMKPGE